MERIKGPSKRRFDEIYNQGRRFRGDFLTLIVHPGNGLVGIATSKKLGSKPQRNRQKRRIFAMLQSLGHFDHHDIVFVASIKCQKAGHATLATDFTQLMGEARIWVGGLESS